MSALPAWFVESDQADANLGYVVGSAGDVNQDGYTDILVSAPFYDAGEVDEGAVFLYLGGASGPSQSPAWLAEGNFSGARFGWTVASGDLDRDGYDDVLIGAPYYAAGEIEEGMAVLYRGLPSGLASTPAWIVEGNQTNAWFGTDLAVADANGDGNFDAVVGAPGYANGQPSEGGAFLFLGTGSGLEPTPTWVGESNQADAYYGTSVGAADVNGDGFADALVGSPAYDAGQVREGAAFVHHGFSGGLALTANRTLEMNRAFAYFGMPVSSAGDVNGDGYEDVVVGASRWRDSGNVDEGAVFLFSGGTGGLSASPTWSFMGGAPGVSMYQGVAAGDLNRDGFDDLAVGAPGYPFNNGPRDGGAFAFLGSPAGPAPLHDWVATGQSGSWFGISVAPAGDVNGDGFPDLLIGAPRHTNGETGEGRAFLFLGQPTAPSEPRNLSAAPGDATNTLSWNSPHSDGGSPVAGYRIYRGTEPGNLSLLTEVVAPGYVDASVTNGQAYFYIVRARNAVGEGSPSVEVTATPLGPPDAPRSLQGVHGDGRVSLSWQPPASDGGSSITNYRIYRGLTSTNLMLRAEIGDVLTFDDTGLQNGITLVYAVSARNVIGEGPRTPETSATPSTVPTAPRSLEVTGGVQRIDLSWLSPDSDGGSPVVSYRISRGSSPTGLSTLTDVFGTTFEDTAISVDTVYYYEVRARNANGEGPASARLSATASAPDATAPTISIVFPQAGSVRESRELTVVGEASDGDVVVRVEVSVDGTTWIQATGTDSWSATVFLPEGASTIRARAVDAAGNVGTTSVTVTLRTASPSMDVTLPLVLGIVIVLALSALTLFVRRRKRRPETP